MAYPDKSRPFEILTDACDYGHGAALVQRVDAGERSIAFASRLLTKTERYYTFTEKECLALACAFKNSTVTYGERRCEI